MKNIMTFKAIKNIVFTIAFILPLQIGLETNMQYDNKNIQQSVKYANSTQSQPELSKVVILDLKSEYCDLKCELAKENDTIDFLAKTFEIKKDNIIEDLLIRNSDKVLIKNNIGYLTDKSGNLKEYDSFEKGFIEYLYDFSKKNPDKIGNTYKPYNGDSDYVIDLIKYFTSIYNNVDYLTAVSIGAAESGYYQVKYMLNYNNVYGGMSNSGLIKHKNIEYGTLSYIRLLSYNYYGNGLTTKEAIGRVYCPTYENGVKVASPHWLNLVSRAMNYYDGTYENITVSKLIED